jgi:hypothetical protein
LKTLLLGLLSFNLYAHDLKYELKSFGHKNPRTEAGIIKETGLNPSDFSQFSCQNEADYRIFSEYLLPENLAMDSIKIQLKDGSVENIKTLNASEVQRIEKRIKRNRSVKFEDHVNYAIHLLMKTKLGAKIITELKKAPEPIFIKQGGNRFLPTKVGERPGFHLNNATSIVNLALKAPMVEKIDFSQLGAGGILTWNPKTKGFKSFLVLAHEMYHAYDSSRGIMDRRFLISEEIEMNEVTEIRAVYFVNQIRKELGLPYRTRYTSSEGPDLIDDNGNPIFIPAPCIDWI